MKIGYARTSTLDQHLDLGVTTENGKNSTLSDLVFVKVIDN